LRAGTGGRLRASCRPSSRGSPVGRSRAGSWPSVYVVSSLVALIGSLALPIVSVLGVVIRRWAIVHAFIGIGTGAHAPRVGAIRIRVVRDRPWPVTGIQVVIVVEPVVVIIVVDVDVGLAVVDGAVVVIARSPARVVDRTIRRRIIRPRTVVHAAVPPRRIVVVVAADRGAHRDARAKRQQPDQDRGFGAYA
jgi:hypothetical protein